MVAADTAGTVGDDAATITVYVIVGVLVAIGVGLALLAAWLWRVTKPDRPLLAPLERMEARRWRRLDPQGRRRALDEVRPEGAVPLEPSKRQPNVDDDYDETAPPKDFDDLVEPTVAVVTNDDLPAPELDDEVDRD